KLQDAPSLEVIRNLQNLCIHVLQPLRDAIGRPVYITSGYRSAKLNAKVGGVPNSRHLLGKAADIHCDNMAYAKVVFDILKKNPYVHRVIIERKNGARWIHVQMY
ncbi:MAG: peptidase M15, partial [Prevotella sp.]|nr:peptidase M15 [Prevotella sp.]